MGEDGLEDMTAAFLQVIHDMKPEQIRCRAEGAVVQYLVQSVRHAYERLQRGADAPACHCLFSE